jgi:hypothetical protein
MVDVWVTLIVFAFMQGPGVHTTPLYMGDDPARCEQVAEDFNNIYVAFPYKKALCLKVGTVYDPVEDALPYQENAYDE